MPVVDPFERGLDLVEQVVGVLLEPLVELAHDTSPSRCRRCDRRSRSRDRPSPRAASRRGARPGARAGAGRARSRGALRKRSRSSASLMRSPQRQRAAVCRRRASCRRARRPCRAMSDPRSARGRGAARRAHPRGACEDGVVRLPALGRRADAHLPGVAVAPDDPGRVAPGTTRSRRLVRGALTAEGYSATLES